MNKVMWFVILLVAIQCSCKNQKTPESLAARKNKQGLEIDSSIKKLVTKEMKETNYSDVMSFAKLDVKFYENGKAVSKIFLTGDGVPHYAMYSNERDTLRIMLTNVMGASYGYIIEKYKDSCRVTYVFSLHEDTTGIFRPHSIPCKFHVILNQSEYKDSERVYGYVEAVSDDFFTRTSAGEIKSRIEFKGFFETVGIK